MGWLAPILSRALPLMGMLIPSTLSEGPNPGPYTRMPFGKNGGEGFPGPDVPPVVKSLGSAFCIGTGTGSTGASTCGSGDTLYSSIDDLAKAYCAQYGGVPDPWKTGAYCYCPKDNYYCWANGGIVSWDHIGMTEDACPKGYKKNVSGLCDLVGNPKGMKPDDYCDFGRSGGSWVDYGDPDCAGGPATILPDGRLLVSGKDENGNPIYYTAQPYPDGSVKVHSGQQMYDQNGNGYIRTSDTTVGSDGTVTSSSQGTQPGTIDTGGSSGPVDKPGSPVQEPTKFPTDYAREDTLQAQLAISQRMYNESYTQTQTQKDINNKLDGLVGQSSPPPDPSFDDGKDKYKDPFLELVKPLFSFSMNTYAGTCPALGFDFTMFAYRFDLKTDAHCTIFDKYKNLITAACLIVYTFGALVILLSA